MVALDEFVIALALGLEAAEGGDTSKRVRMFSLVKRQWGALQTCSSLRRRTRHIQGLLEQFLVADKFSSLHIANRGIDDRADETWTDNATYCTGSSIGGFMF
jgi:hypothetical protein